MKVTLVTSMIVTVLTATTPATAAWYNPVSWVGGNSCADVPYNRADYKYNGKKFKKETLKAQAKDRAGFVGDTFVDEYTGEVSPLFRINSKGKQVTNAEVDHIVPLKVIHANGGCKLSPAEKKAVGNNPKNLAVTTHLNNRVKGSKTPSQWLPRGHEASYLNRYNKAAEFTKAPTFHMKAFKFNNPKVVRYIRTTGKVTGYTAAGAALVFSGAGAAAILIPIGIDAVDEIIVISSDPDAYTEELSADFADAYNISVSWTSAKWDITKDWSAEAWDNSIDWSKSTWSTVTNWTGNTYKHIID